MPKGIIEIKCPQCEKMFGISLDTFDQVKQVEFTCGQDGQRILVELDKKNERLIVQNR